MESDDFVSRRTDTSGDPRQRGNCAGANILNKACDTLSNSVDAHADRVRSTADSCNNFANLAEVRRVVNNVFGQVAGSRISAYAGLERVMAVINNHEREASNIPGTAEGSHISAAEGAERFLAIPSNREGVATGESDADVLGTLRWELRAPVHWGDVIRKRRRPKRGLR
jgi:hypothetical protein